MEENTKYQLVDDLIRRKNLHIRPTTTGYRGVNRDKRENSPNKYRAQFSVGLGGKGFKLYLGSYDTPEEAYIARIKFIDSLK